jgi:hypothetical protein
VKAVRVAQVVAIGGYTLGESLFSAPRALALLARAHENRFALGVALYLSHLACELAYSTAAFEITYNGHALFSKLREGRYPAPGEVAGKLRAILAAEQAAGAQLATVADDRIDGPTGAAA